MKHNTNAKTKTCHSKETSYHHFPCNLLDIITDLTQPSEKSHTTYPPSIHKHQQPLPQQIHILQQQVEQILQLQKRQNGFKKRNPETRTCYRCNTYGHIAKNCRRAPTNKTARPKRKTIVQPTRYPHRDNTKRDLLKTQVPHQQRDRKDFKKDSTIYKVSE